MEKPLLRWGILGTANIAQKNWKAIWNSQNGRVAAVASRDLQRSRRFIKACQAQVPFGPAPRAFGSYEELLAAPEIDAVYIPLPTGIRGHWVKRAAAAGKHVICEKPCATSVVELVEMLDTCQRNRVQFMDDVMFMHSRRLERIREVLDDGQTIGPIRRITSAFTFRAEEEFFVSNIRAQSDLEPDGCLGDLGWYCIRFALWAMNWKVPQQSNRPNPLGVQARQQQVAGADRILGRTPLPGRSHQQLLLFVRHRNRAVGECEWRAWIPPGAGFCVAVHRKPNRLPNGQPGVRCPGLRFRNAAALPPLGGEGAQPQPPNGPGKPGSFAISPSRSSPGRLTHCGLKWL